ncbi:hypothetical protein H6G91_35120 [Nostoc muscorum FACHB-395]|uniref:hypothetical protein n=1 Tax=Nostoc sp. C057 TaxID=2576903 RepID=UPI0015C399EC|nr:hypothetical protein [Nostoc sp. C057]MBD2512387.1 hypothetical protein [Desmonostoc muscorum FACHB-395]QLE53109.1 hypothetical protein FD724_34735 [Nostoc sp. C057]
MLDIRWLKAKKTFEIAIALQEFNKYYADPKGVAGSKVEDRACLFVSMRFWLLSSPLATQKFSFTTIEG